MHQSVCQLTIYKNLVPSNLICQSVLFTFSKNFHSPFLSVRLSSSYFEKLSHFSFWSVSLSASYFGKSSVSHFGLSVCQTHIFKFFTFFILVCQSVSQLFQKSSVYHSGLSVCLTHIFKNFTSLILVCQSFRLTFSTFSH